MKNYSNDNNNNNEKAVFKPHEKNNYHKVVLNNYIVHVREYNIDVY